MESPASSSSPASIPVDQFLKQLGDSTLFSAEEVQSLLAGLQPAQRGDARTLVDVLVKQEKLTRYQGQMLLQGKSKGLVLGNYAILDKLGQGGMGMVFKARHKRMKRLVALKVLAPAITKNPTAVQRFQREVEAAAKLSHPNIVAAYDADEAKGVHFLVMEYVEGSDLAKLVKTSGPLQPAQAAQCILQAAHGLLHAHQSGIIHRDIKPHNLLLEIGNRKSAIGNVKILDMGLARIEGGNTPGSGAGGLTESGSIMGTCDYMAPEQAMNTKNADARADIYSLGCTLYYLLSGKAMYGGETAMEKLMAHQSEPIPPLRTVCPEVPKKVEAVYQKMVAKKVADRYQSMAEVIADLEACNLPATPLSGLSATLPAVSAKQADAGGETRSSIDDMTQAAEQSPLTKPRKSRKRWLIAGGVLALLGLAIIAVSTDKGTFIIETDDPEVSVALDKAGGVVLHDKKTDRKYQLKAGTHQVRSGEYELLVSELPDGLEFSTRTFTIKRNGEVRVKASLAGGGRQASGGKTVDAAWIKQVQAMPAEKQVEAVAAKLKELNPGFDGKVEHRIVGGVVLEFGFFSDVVTDIRPVRALAGLKRLDVTGSVAHKSNFSDLSPLQGMSLIHVLCARTKVKDLSPLKGMPLKALYCGTTLVEDLSPLKDMGLEILHFSGSRVRDISPLEGMSLKDLWYDFKPADAPLVRSIKTLKTINNKPAAEFWKDVDAKQTALDAWIKRVQAMPAEKQVEAVAAKLKEGNPGFDGRVEPTIKDGVVIALTVVADNVTDLSALRGLAGLQTLRCLGSPPSKGRLADLSPLRGMKLTTLICPYTQVADLTPLQGMPLTRLECGGAPVADLAPLKGMPLAILSCVGTQVADLSPLKGMPLTTLDCGGTKITDLAPLKGMPLASLFCGRTKVTDLSPLLGMPLKDLRCDFKAERDVEILRSIKTLEKINEKPAAEFWKEVDARQSAFDAWVKQVQAMPAEKQVEAVAAKLKELNPGFDGKVTHKVVGGAVAELAFVTDRVTDIAPVRALTGLQRLLCRGSKIGLGRLADLSPLTGMKLTTLYCDSNLVADLSPLKDMKLTYLDCGANPVTDLSPLKDMKLTTLICSVSHVSDLSPLKDMKLTWLNCNTTKVTDLSPLKGMPLTWLDLYFTPVTDLSPLKGIPLTNLTVRATPVSDLSPLKDMKLASFGCKNSKVTDLSPLKDLPLTEIECDFQPERDADILRAIKTLKTINGKPAAEFWKDLDKK